MKPVEAIGSGIAGAAALTVVHESLRRLIPQAPRMDLLGMQAIQKLMHHQEQDEKVSSSNKLHTQALAGDLLANSIYYSIAGASKRHWLAGFLSGLGAGVAAVTLPKSLGLDEENTNRTPATTAMTIGLYTLGGLAAAAFASIIKKKD